MDLEDKQTIVNLQEQRQREQARHNEQRRRAKRNRREAQTPTYRDARIATAVANDDPKQVTVGPAVRRRRWALAEAVMVDVADALSDTRHPRTATVRI